RIWLSLSVPRRGSRSHSPVIKNHRNVADAVGQLGEAQNEIVILTAVQAVAKSADLGEDAPPVDSKVTHVVARGEQVRRPGRLEVWIAKLSLGIYLVFV